MAIIRTYISDRTDTKRKRAQAMNVAETQAHLVATAIKNDPSLLLGLSLKLIELVCRDKDALKLIEPAITKMAKKCPHTYKVFAAASMK